MTTRLIGRTAVFGLVLVSLAGCGGGLFRGGDTAEERRLREAQVNESLGREEGTSTIWDLFTNVDDPNVTVEVNRYIWNAALDILDFMPIEAADPFSGVIVYGYGTPPGSGRAYRATVFIRDPALDARSLNVALVSRSGPAPTETVRAIEDAILTRARQLRVRDANL